MQNMTTKEPDDGMIEVAIAAVEAVFDWQAYLRENFPDVYKRTGAKDGLENHSQTDKTEGAAI